MTNHLVRGCGAGAYSAVLALGTFAAGAACPPKASLANVQAITFPDQTIAMATPLAVNPDGALRSYTVGDHGYTYVVNGVDLWVNDKRKSCQDRTNGCRQKWLDAEKAGFAAGTAEFYSYAIEGEGLDGAPPTKVKGGYILGNGKGRPRVAAKVPTAGGEEIEVYRSMTALTHEVGNKVAYLDSSLVPTLVAPSNGGVGLGQVAWLRRGSGAGVFAVVGDIGPEYGEGSVALHQLLRNGALAEQVVGPIPKASRCTAVETGLKAPFVTRFDVPQDSCAQTNGKPKGGADIRAYQGISDAIDVLILGKARLPATGNRVSGEITMQRLADIAAEAGYDTVTLEAMGACLH